MNYIFKDHEVYVFKDDLTYLVHATFPLLEEGVVNIDHTYVDVSLRGQGVASEMMHAVMTYVIEKKYQVVATCPYAVSWLKRHKEYDIHVDHETMAHMGEACIIT